MKKTSIKKIRSLYNEFSREYKVNYKNHLNFFNYLNLSVLKSRDEREFDPGNYKLLDSLISSNLFIIKKKLKSKKKINVYFKYLSSFKEFEYLPSVEFLLTLIKDLLKYFKQILDILGIIIISLILITVKNNKTINQKLKNSKIFSIYFWNTKRNDSAKYYYPSIEKIKNKRSFIISFADSKFLSYSLLLSLKTDYLSPLNILSIKYLFLSILQFLHLYLYDLCTCIKDCNYNFLKFWIGWKKSSEIFYSILTYNSLISLTSFSENCEFISWTENQVTNNAFALGVNYVLKKNNSNSSLSNYYGSPFSKLGIKQYLPIRSEINIGFYGTKFYFQDNDSMKEMKEYLIDEQIYINSEVVDKNMIRISSYKKKSKSNFTNTRELTIFTNDSYWDLIACVSALYKTNNKNAKDLNKSFQQNNLVFIRLHPSLNRKEAIRSIKEIEEIPENVKYEFINYKHESIITSMKNSNYCIFGLSTYINIAIDLKCKVIGVETNHINSIPIKSDFINSPYLEINNPW